MKCLILYIFLIFNTLLHAQSFNFAFTQGSALGSEEGVKLTTDAQGNIYEIIQYDSTFSIDSAGSSILINSNNNGLNSPFLYIGRYGIIQPANDIVLIKFDCNGKYQWHIFIDMLGRGSENPFSDFTLGLKTDATGNIYMSGSLFVYDSVNFISSNKTIALKCIASGFNTYNTTQNKISFVLKANNAGIIQWVNTIHSSSFIGTTAEYSGYNQCQDLTLDILGNVYVHLLYQNNVIVSSKSGINYTYYDSSSQGSSLIKYNTNGFFQSFNQLTTKLGKCNSNTHSLVSDSIGNLYALMEFNLLTADTLNFPTPIPLIPGPNYLLAKADTAGNWLWAGAVCIGVSYNPVLAVNSLGTKIFVGHTYQALNFYSASGFANGNPYPSNGGTDMLVTCLNTNGTELWTQTFGGTNNDTLCGIACNEKQDFFLLGVTNSSQINFGNSYVNAPSNISVFVSQFDSSYNNLNAKSINGRINLYQPSGSGALSFTKNNKGYFTGYFYDSLIIGCITIKSKGKSDAFIIEYSPVADTIFIKACSSYQSSSGKYIWNSSGIYYDTLKNSFGCDSVLLFRLKILNSSDSIYRTFCTTYKSPSGKYIYTSSGKYYDTIPNSKNCDSIITINLTSLNSSIDSVAASFCKMYSSPSGKYIYTTSGKYYDTLTNAKGCDSIIIIKLVSNKTTSVNTINVCKPINSPSGKYIYTSSGQYVDTIPNSKNCDSIITLNINFLNSFDSIQANFCKTYTSPSGKYIYTTSGKYVDTIPNSKSCDSIITINLINLTTTNFIKVVSCSTYKSASGKYVYSSSGIFMDTIPNSKSCDSIITIDFTISKPIVKVSKSNDIDCNNKSVNLLAQGATKYVWSPTISLSNYQISTPIATPISTIVYTVLGSDTNGCVGLDSIQIIVTPTRGISLIPNVFTPNGDGINECFSIDSAGSIKSLNFYIYNRWGTLIFYTTNPEGCWDGKNESGQPVSESTYFYVAEGITNCNSHFEIRGTVQVIR